MPRKPGSLCRFVCTKCGEGELVSGGSCNFVCSGCKPPPTVQYLAHQAVARAIRSGLLAKPASFPCADCGGAATEYDHRDYSKPLAVDPLCRGCNARRGPALNTTAYKPWQRKREAERAAA